MTNELNAIKDSRAAIGNHITDIYRAKLDRQVRSIHTHIEELEAILLRSTETGDTDSRIMPNDGTVGSR